MKWQHCSIDELAVLVTKGTTPTTSGGRFVDEGVNFVKAEALNGDSSLDERSFAHIDNETHERLSRSILEVDDVLVTIAGANIGKCGLVKERHLPANTNQAVGIIRPDRDRVLPAFVYYFFKQNRIFSFIQSLNAQAAQPNINLTTLKRVPIPIPSLAAQQSIVEMLSAYDDLIENNHRRIQLLEESARLLYREWFVHLRFPGHEHVKVVDGVPEGWFLKNIDALIRTVRKPQKIKANDYLEDGPYPCVDQGRTLVGGYTDNKEAVIFDSLPLVVFGDHTRIVKYVDFPFAPGADGTQLLQPKDESLSSLFLYFLIKQVDLSNYFYARHFKFLKTSEVIVPPKQLIDEFSKKISPFMDEVRILRTQNYKLAIARDLLLPRLMRGEIAV